MEREFQTVSSTCSRPLNLDPGYITQAKLVLATTKDRDHRIYLRDGIFAEITLNYTAKRWVHHRWSYPDYRTGEVAEFALACRNRLARLVASIWCRGEIGDPHRRETSANAFFAVPSTSSLVEPHGARSLGGCVFEVTFAC